MTPEVRPAEPRDFPAIARISYATAFFGQPGKVFFPDERLFGDLWTDPYRVSGCCAFVACRDAEVLGYVIGACDSAAYRRGILGAAPHWFFRWLRGEYPQWRGCLPYLRRALRYPSRHAPAEFYPAHLHINLLSEARGAGLGGRLLESYLECLQSRGVRGVQLSTTRENEAALKLYQRMGFTVWLEYESPLWRPWLGRNAVHVVMVREIAAELAGAVQAGAPG